MNAAFSRPGSTQGAVRSIGAPGTRDGFGNRNEVNTRQGNQQARINGGVNSGPDDAEGETAERGESRLEHQPVRRRPTVRRMADT